MGPFGLFDIYKENDFIDSAKLQFDENTKLELQIEGFEGIYEGQVISNDDGKLIANGVGRFITNTGELLYLG